MSAFRFGSPPSHDISGCIRKYSRSEAADSESTVWVRDLTCTQHLLLTEGPAVLHVTSNSFIGTSLAFLVHTLFWNCECGQLFSCELKPRNQCDDTLQKNKQTLQFRWDSERVIILGPLVLGGLGERVGRSVNFPPCWQQNFLMTSFWLILLNFYNTS